jgi:hypothetical protein
VISTGALVVAGAFFIGTSFNNTGRMEMGCIVLTAVP